MYYTHNLLNVAEQYVNLGKYNKADSVLLLASNYDVDSAYYARVVDVYALALYNQQLYDSALVLLLGIKDYPRNIDARCYSYQMIMRLYNKQSDLGDVGKLDELTIKEVESLKTVLGAIYYDKFKTVYNKYFVQQLP
jgi:hypothetical protein